jgi:hypothetical protein
MARASFLLGVALTTDEQPRRREASKPRDAMPRYWTF